MEKDLIKMNVETNSCLSLHSCVDFCLFCPNTVQRVSVTDSELFHLKIGVWSVMFITDAHKLFDRTEKIRIYLLQPIKILLL